MPSGSNDDETDRSPAVLAGLSALGVAFVIAGVGLYYGLAIDSMRVFTAAAAAIFVLLAVSMVIIIRSEPLFSRENAVISVFVFTAMALFFGLSTFTMLPFPVLVGVLIFVGAILPGIVLQYGPSIIN
ncbi:hypothetical protein AArcSl_1661 [Halalkaliarchaeum desulfuricum]|uniref:Uncharacterized protein n=1 Tax=Halalkaliarchaeum desulfuricum TaxID=2055893 RepID=A0A343TJL8_9EURY|nr:hypothetical protein [Halalkaliarchaeum desulfuricum]AUX09290.1 hypothetical protein AArcSl_1661 [Halalkaliarchaeum desulfuricum]